MTTVISLVNSGDKFSNNTIILEEKDIVASRLVLDAAEVAGLKEVIWVCNKKKFSYSTEFFKELINTDIKNIYKYKIQEI